MSPSSTIVTSELAEPTTPPGATVLNNRAYYVSRYWNSGKPLSPVEAIDFLAERLVEAERTLAKVAHALNGDGRRAA